ncbi:Mobile element protein [Candidatus Enterovibrio escicola]|uniref:Mobile element protein n=4 Tax=Candidatus Enterovibrio escicola TaxID=1927127 RepID=A0A2A5T7G5_9GAMM|nr:Mobile element protein [Candidatus Enterovibrio escacola]
MGKDKHKISNWKQYNQALVNRSSVTFWIYVAAIKVWHCLKYHGHRGREFIFSDTAIETALIVKGILISNFLDYKVFLIQFLR